MSELARQGRDSAPAPLPLREQATAPAPLETDAPAAKSEPPDAPAVRAGVMLRQVREAAGIDADLLANALKVPLYRIEALEAGRLELLPDITFARGLAASICRHLGGDAAAVLACMPTSRHGLYSPASNAGYAPFHRASDRPASLLSHLFSRPVLIILALLALGAAALSLLPTLPIRLNAPAETAQDGAREDGAHAPAPGMVVEAVSEHSDSPLAAQPPLQPEPPASSTPALPAPAAAPARVAFFWFAVPRASAPMAGKERLAASNTAISGFMVIVSSFRGNTAGAGIAYVIVSPLFAFRPTEEK